MKRHDAISTLMYAGAVDRERRFVVAMEKAVAGATALQNASRRAFGGIGFDRGNLLTVV
jgi:hypothetical protein